MKESPELRRRPLDMSNDWVRPRPTLSNSSLLALGERMSMPMLLTDLGDQGGDAIVGGMIDCLLGPCESLEVYVSERNVFPGYKVGLYLFRSPQSGHTASEARLWRVPTIVCM